MTREEAIEALTSKDVCNPDLILEALDMAIEALKQEPLNDVLDKIMAEIDREYKWLMNTRYTIHDVNIAFGYILGIIDKYRKGDKDT